MSKDLTFIFNLEPYTKMYEHHDIVERDSQRMCLMMCSSIKASHPDSKIIGMSANGNMPDSKTLEELSKIGVEFDNTVVEANPFNGFFNKIHAYHHLSRKVTTPYVCLLDIDVLLLKEINFEKIKILLEKYDALSALGHEGRLTQIKVNPMYLRAFKSKEHEFYMEEKHGVTAFNLFPSGIMFFKSSNLPSFMDEWLDKSKEIVKDEKLLDFYSKEVFQPLTLTDEEPLSQVINNKNVLMIRGAEFKHYHIFTLLNRAIKEGLELSENIIEILKKYDFPFSEELV